MSSYRDEQDFIAYESARMEIRRLHGVCREYREELEQLTSLVRCLVKGMRCEGIGQDFVEKCLVLGGAETELHNLLATVMREA